MILRFVMVVFLCFISYVSADPTRYSVMIKKPDHTVGSGIVINHNGKKMILTAAHVAERFKEKTSLVEIDEKGIERVKPHSRFQDVIIVSRRGNTETTRKGRVSVFNVDWKPDLAVILPESEDGLQAVELAEKPKLEPGIDVWYCGAGNGVPFHLVKSIFNGIELDGKYRVNGEGWYGHSGSGLLIKQKGEYKLIGVVTELRGLHDIWKQPVLCEPLPMIRDFLKYVK